MLESLYLSSDVFPECHHIKAILRSVHNGRNESKLWALVAMILTFDIP